MLYEELLLDRKQEVVDGVVSTCICLQVLFGVPQGSILGPSLFML